MKRLTFVLTALLAGCAESAQETAKLHEAWKAANPAYNHLTLEQWSTLREHDMLPNVDYARIYAKQAKESADSAATTSAINLGLNSATSPKK